MATDLFDTEAAAARLGVSPRTVRRLVAQRAVTHYRVGRLVRFRPSDLDAFLAAGRCEAA